jgi:hypothetical protein
MARVTKPSTDTEILADWDTGNYSREHGGTKTQRDLSNKHNVSIGKINKLVKGRIPTMHQVVNKLVTAKQELAEQNEMTVNAVNKLVEERVKDVAFFNNIQRNFAGIAVAKVKQGLDEQGKPRSNFSMTEFKACSDIVATSRAGVLGKESPETVINNNNAQQNVTTIRVINAEDMTDEEVAAYR